MRPTVRTLRRKWRSLPAPPLESLAGDLRASFVPPLTRIAPRGLGLVGLLAW